jgi:hypothetical protein
MPGPWILQQGEGSIWTYFGLAFTAWHTGRLDTTPLVAPRAIFDHQQV